MGHFPFSTSLADDQIPLEWWTVLKLAPQAETFAILAIKLFSVVSTSMADERTSSVQY
ncbi:uncharacterized protein FIBRA_08857 [Fibroporia radiculosa]|uniref:HAT C-terminal dimerisation domain-containing protein n=1 Tax=Fibroporia radiculosa TaxID=599839 RepID=J4H5E1_9APHY|nr:uncharacterized protein FIBRA_08857 [Fibroporia radiculosa]CCM06579.1 predicted protein [Fibroporia radiculosa]